ncbi:MAG: glycosyltransferase [Calditrichaeota bacterium]|nr:MAG: glycosyltransferase [Calditrichota bacterium]
MKKPLISLCMIVKNEALRLNATLKAAGPHVDEIVIVDTGSSDGTMDIARRFTEKVFSFEWVDDFAAARNYAISKCSGRWLLNLDADHVLHVPSHFDLRTFLQNSNYLAFFIDERSVAPGKRFASLYRLLLFRNRPEFRYKGIIHENPLETINAYAQKHHSGKAWSNLPGVYIEHSGYSDPQLKLQRNRPLLEKAVKKEPNNFHYRYKLLMTYKALNDEERYSEYLNRSTRLILDNNPPLSESVIGIWGLYGYWALDRKFAPALDIFKAGALQIGKKIFWRDARLALPYSRMLMHFGDMAAAFDILNKNLQQCICPRHIPFPEDERLDVAVLWLRCATESMSVEQTLRVLGRRSEWFKKALVDEQQFRVVLQKRYPELLSWLNPAEAKTETNEGTSISLCMIVKDEAQNLPRCLDSVRSVVDEIIIVDTGSRDQTVSIAEQYGARIFRYAWKGDFATMRNLALKEARHPWILHLDADEALQPIDKKTLNMVLDQAVDGLDVIVRNHQPEADIVSFMDDRQIRFFRNKPGIRYRNRVHEQIGPSILDNGGEIVDANIVVHHYGYMHNNQNRARRNLHLLNDELRAHPDDAYILFKLGETHKALDDYDTAADYLKQALRNPGGKIGNEIKETIYLRLAQIELSAGHYEEAVSYGEGCLRFNPQNFVAMYVVGVAGMYCGRIEQSMAYFLQLRDNYDKHSIDLSDMEKLIRALEEHSESRALH